MKGLDSKEAWFRFDLDTVGVDLQYLLRQLWCISSKSRCRDLKEALSLHLFYEFWMPLAYWSKPNAPFWVYCWRQYQLRPISWVWLLFSSNQKNQLIWQTQGQISHRHLGCQSKMNSFWWWEYIVVSQHLTHWFLTVHFDSWLPWSWRSPRAPRETNIG